VNRRSASPAICDNSYKESVSQASSRLTLFEVLDLWRIATQFIKGFH
jgi:hypothetical protein